MRAHVPVTILDICSCQLADQYPVALASLNASCSSLDLLGPVGQMINTELLVYLSQVSSAASTIKPSSPHTPTHPVQVRPLGPRSAVSQGPLVGR